MRKNFGNIAIAIVFMFGLFSPTTGQVVQAKDDQINNLQSDSAEIPTNRIIIKYKEGTDASFSPSLTPQMKRVNKASDQSLQYVREMSNDLHVLELPERLPIEQVEAITQQLETLPEVEYAEPDRIYKHTLVPDDDFFNDQWHYYDTWGINAPTAWETTTGSTDVVIAVIDTGRTDHVDLNGRYVTGYDFISYTQEANDGDGRDADPQDEGDWITSGENASGYFAGCGVSDSSWHGTHVAGTIGAESDNNDGVAGVDWNAKILPVRVLGKCGGYTSDIVDGMLWAAGLAVSGVPANANPANIINLSLGGTGSCSTTEQNAITEIVEAGVVVVTAAGNDNLNVSTHSPSNCTGVIAVAATDQNGQRASYSNFGTGVDISAPGGGNGLGDVLSTVDTGLTTPSGDGYAGYMGTSMATPHVSGVLGLMFAVNPDLIPVQALTLMQASAKTFPGGTCNTTNCGAGIVDAAAVLELTGMPDLIITDLTFNPASPAPGTAFDINVTVKNQGGTTSESLVYRDVYVDRDPSTFIDPGTSCPIDENEYESDYFRSDFNASIPPGVEETQAVEIDGPPLTPGPHQLWVYIDATCINEEGIENNNVYGPINIWAGTSADGMIQVTSDGILAGSGRLHLDSQITAYNSKISGATDISVPMLFKNQFGGDYDSALYIQNTANSTANYTIDFYDVYGAFTCSVGGSVAPLSSVNYWLPNTPACLPAVWSGGANITSNQPITAVGRSHIGSEVTSYNDFSAGSNIMFVPMLFKNQFGGDYDSALYVQNLSASPANIAVTFYDVYGNYTDTMLDTLQPLSATGYWIPNRTSLPEVWSGGAIVTSDQPIVAIGRPHIGNQVTAYNGFAAGSTTIHVPMLYKNKPGTGGTYSSAVYVQNVDLAEAANITISFYDDDGNFSGSMSTSLASLSSTGFWLPLREFLPDPWSGSAIVTSDRPIVALGRLHIDGEIMTYNGSEGNSSMYVPMLFEDAFDGSNYDSALVLQNTQATDANVNIKYYSKDGLVTCTYTQLLEAFATLNLWSNDFACP